MRKIIIALFMLPLVTLSLKSQTCWQKVSTVPDSYTRLIKVNNGNYLCAAQGPTNRLYSSNDLLTFTPLACPMATHNLAFGKANNGYLYFATGHDGVFRSVDSGANWSYNFASCFGCGALDFATDQLDYLYCSVGGSSRGLYVSSDSGTSWNNAFGGLDFPEIECVDAYNKVFIINPGCRLWYSDNQGGAWNEITAQPFSDNSVMVKHVDSTIYVFAKNGDIYYSIDGTSWNYYSNIPISGTATAYCNDAVFPLPGLWWVGYYDQGVWRSQDDGMTWTREDSCMTGIFHFLYSEGNTLMATTDSGIFKFDECTFSLLLQPVSDTLSIGSDIQFIVASTDSNATFQWQIDTGSGFYNIIDFGQFSGSANDTLTVSNITMRNYDNHFRCVITSGVCVDTSETAILSVYDDTGIKFYAGSEIRLYPNPANNYLNVRINAELTGSFYFIRDKLGRVVKNGQLNVMNNTIKVNDLSGGIYLFSIENEFVQTFIIINN